MTEDENIDLAELKQKMGVLLMALKEANLLSVIHIGSTKPSIEKPSISKKPTKEPLEDQITPDPIPSQNEAVAMEEEEEKPDHRKRNDKREPSAERIYSKPPQRQPETDEEK